MNRQKAWNDFVAILENTEDAIKLYRSGRKNQYRQVAINLNTLLCDGEVPLLIRIFPKAVFHPLNGLTVKLSKKNPSLFNSLIFSPPGTIRSDGKGGAKIENLFYKGELLPLKEWLEQPLASKHITIREFIKSIADKEGKHSDPTYGLVLDKVKIVSLASVQFHPELIVTLGEYVHGVLSNVSTSWNDQREISQWISQKN